MSPSASTRTVPSSVLLWGVPLAIWSIGFVAFLPALWNGFVDWDDRANFLDNQGYRGLGVRQLRWMFTTLHMGHYAPLTWVTHGLDYELWGMKPAGYHLTSMLLHATNAALVYLVAARLLRAARPDFASESARRLGAGFAALLFAVHPLRVESVAWATERRDVLSGLFYLLALLLYFRAIDGASLGALWRSRWYWGCLATFACALLSKSMSVSLPVVMLVLDVYPLRRLDPGPRSWSRRPGRQVLLEKIPFVLLAGVASVTSLVAVERIQDLPSVVDVTLPERLAVSLYGLAFYLWKTVAPVDLSPLYARRLPIEWWTWPFLLSGAVVVAITAIAVVMRRRWPWLLTVWITYSVILLPVLGVAQGAWHLAADRYTYLACLGWACLAGAALATWWDRSRAERTRHRTRALGPAIALVMIALLGTLTWRQTGIWRSSEALWRHALSVSPSALAHASLAMSLQREGQWVRALEQFDRAVRIDPRNPIIRLSMGSLLAERGHWTEAGEHFRHALQFRPRDPVAHHNLAAALAKDGRWNEAIPHYREALALDPRYVEAHINLGVALDRVGRLDDGLAHFSRAVEIEPRSAVAQNNLGIALARRQRRDEAIARFREALRLDPGYRPADVNLTEILAQRP
jgi:tetratricopeptide (TPR) repeat protein